MSTKIKNAIRFPTKNVFGINLSKHLVFRRNDDKSISAKREVLCVCDDRRSIVNNHFI